MIGNFSFEEHVKYFNGMYNHLKSIDETMDDTTIINVIKSKVMIEQEQENIKYNLNIKNISNTPMVKDFKIWSSKYDLNSGDEEKSEEESNEEESEAQNSDDEEGSEDGYDFSAPSRYDEAAPPGYYSVEEVRRRLENSANQNHNFIPSIFDIPEDY